MRINMDLYTHSHYLVKIMAESIDDKPTNIISRITGATGIPVMAVAIMVGKYNGYSDELKKSMAAFQAFYRYDTFEGLGPYADLPGFPEDIKALWLKR